MTIRYVEVRSGFWIGAANAICKELKAVGAKKRQIICIDAHNNSPGGDAIMSAFWDDNIASTEPLQIAFHNQHADYGWHEFYKIAADQVSTLRPDRIISMTGSCNDGDGSGVFFVFYYSDGPLVGKQDIRFCESRGRTWEIAAQDLVANLMNSGAKVGQIISIDAHNNTNRGDAIFSAFWNASLPANGGLQIKHQGKNDQEPWDRHYKWASNTIASGKENLDVHSITSSCNSEKNGVTYIFHAPDDVLSVEYELDKGEISASKPKVVATQTNTNTSSADQKIIFQYTESESTSTSNTSSFSHEVGVELKVGTEFKAGVPFVADGKISTELTTSYSHSWGEETTISNDFSQTTQATAEVIAKPNTEVECKFIVQQAKLNVPFVMTLKSGKVINGVWNGVNCWDFNATFTEKPL